MALLPNNPKNENILTKVRDTTARIRQAPKTIVERQMDYGGRSDNSGNKFSLADSMSVPRRRDTNTGQTDVLNAMSFGRNTENDRGLNILKKAMGTKLPGMEDSTATTRSELLREFAQKTAEQKRQAAQLASAQNAVQTGVSTAANNAASGSLNMGSSSSGGKATYNVRNFSASKAGADYVNKNSPFSGYAITSYTGARNTGIKGASTNHAGIDRAVPEGTRVSVPINTTFYKSGSDNARGNWIELKDANGNILHFQHLQSFATGLKAGDPISAGTAFAVSGSTGVGRAHLHEEYYTPDGSVNITESYWNKYAPLGR